MTETLADRIIRIQHEQNISSQEAGRVARAEIRIEKRKREIRKTPNYRCDLCGHHMDSHFRNAEKCLRGSCQCVAYTKLEGEN